MQRTENKRRKRTQCDYNLGFKLAVVEQVEKGEMTYRQAQASYGIQGKTTVLVWLRKHGRLDWSQPEIYAMKNPKAKETPAQKIKRLEKELADEKLKNEILNRMIDVADEQYGTAIRKKVLVRIIREFQIEKKISLSRVFTLTISKTEKHIIRCAGFLPIYSTTMQSIKGKF